MKLKERAAVTKRGYATLRAYAPGLIRAKAAAAVIEAVLPFVTVWFSARIINELLGQRSLQRLILYVVLTIGLHFALSMAKNILDKLADDKQAGMFQYFEKIFADKRMGMDYVDLEDPDIQKMEQKAKENLFMFGNGLGQLVWSTTTLVKVPVVIVISACMTASLFAAKSGNPVLDSPVWIPAILVLMVLYGLVYSYFTKKDYAVFEKWTENTVWYNRTFLFYGHELYDNTRRAKDVRMYGQEKLADREMERLEEHNRQDNGFISRMSGYNGMMYLTRGVGNALCYLFVAAKAALGAFGVGSIIQYAAAFTELVQNIGLITWYWSENRTYTEHLGKLFEYLDLPNRKYQGTLPVEKSYYCRDGENEYEIEFRDVSFKYPGSDAWVLRHVNTKLRTGKKQALVGENGAGKTTFVKLLCRLYDPTEGVILLNGIDIRKYDYEEYMRLFAFVFQDFKLFSFTLGQNIAAGQDYDGERVEDCIRKVSLYDRFSAMPRGLDTYLYRDIAPDGVEISGGEAQKIALARALYKDTPVIVLDEPTAALDPLAEAQLYADFSNLVGDRTAVYISHRLSSCRFCDEITVFDRGEIVQKGDHETLVRDETGKYYALWNAQARYYADTPPEPADM